ncbi:MAG: deoxyribose-phosphate aldolase [Acidimicrobiales bacterium]
MASDSLASLIDHTLLKPEAGPAQIEALCAEANQYQVAAICVSPSRLPIVDGWLEPGIDVCTVIGFPSGAHQAASKAAEAALAIEHGANEVDMVIDLGQAKSGDWAAVESSIALVRRVAPAEVTLKVIIESGALTDDEIVAACRAAESAGADFVKTSTGFHPSGGATLEAVRLMASTVGGRLGVKASGGIRDFATATAMVEAGATRLGTSSTAAILRGEG